MYTQGQPGMDKPEAQGSKPSALMANLASFATSGFKMAQWKMQQDYMHEKRSESDLNRKSLDLAGEAIKGAVRNAQAEDFYNKVGVQTVAKKGGGVEKIHPHEFSVSPSGGVKIVRGDKYTEGLLQNTKAQTEQLKVKHKLEQQAATNAMKRKQKEDAAKPVKPVKADTRKPVKKATATKPVKSPKMEKPKGTPKSTVSTPKTRAPKMTGATTLAPVVKTPKPGKAVK